MPLMTLQDRIVLLKNHTAAIERAIKRGESRDIGEWFRAIASVATEAAEQHEAIAKEEGPK